MAFHTLTLDNDFFLLARVTLLVASPDFSIYCLNFRDAEQAKLCIDLLVGIKHIYLNMGKYHPQHFNTFGHR